MSVLQFALVALCVLAMCVGQLLFKRAAIDIEILGTILHWRVALVTLISLSIYGAATLLWIYLLRNIALNQAYPFMAISFIVIPLLSAVFFGETITSSYIIGMLLIVGGISIIALN